MVDVIFDYGIANEWVATFADEKTYMLCLPHLEVYAKQLGAKVVESVNETIQEQQWCMGRNTGRCT